MTSIIHVAAPESQDSVAVIYDGELVYSGPNIPAKELFELIQNNVLVADHAEYHVVTQEQMADPLAAVYGTD